jgi:hypothetical protein
MITLTEQAVNKESFEPELRCLNQQKWFMSFEK